MYYVLLDIGLIITIGFTIIDTKFLLSFTWARIQAKYA